MQDKLKIWDLSKKVQEKLRNKSFIQEELSAGKSGQEILDFADETMAKFYQAAYLLFENKQYQDAVHAFLFLANLNPHNYDYWLGLGMSMQLYQQYEAAIDAYELSALCEINSPVPYFYLAKCLFAIHDRESALQALNLAIETAGETEEYAELKQQAEIARDILLSQFNI